MNQSGIKEPKLEPCPFCGSTAEFQDVSINDETWPGANGDWYLAGCKQCGLWLPESEYSSMSEAALAWNTRARPQSSVEWKPKTRDDFVNDFYRLFDDINDGSQTRWKDCLRLIDEIYTQAQKELREENERLREIIDDLRHLIVDHHSYHIMKNSLAICPACSQSDALLNRAAIATDRKEG